MRAQRDLAAFFLSALALLSTVSCGSSGNGGDSGGGGAAGDAGGSGGAAADAADDETSTGGTGGALPDAAPGDASDGSDDVADAGIEDVADAALDVIVDATDEAAAETGADASVPVVDQIAGVVVSTMAGSGTSGTQDGTGSAAQFNNPVNLALAPNGSLIVADFDNSMLRTVTSSGVVSTLTDQAGFIRPFGLTFTPSGELIVQTDRNAAGQGGTTTGTLWTVDTATGAATIIEENLGRPRGLAAWSGTSLFLSDLAAHWTRTYDLSTKAATLLAGAAGVPGFVDGEGAAARFDGPYGAAKTPNGNIVMADSNNHAIRTITPSGMVTTLAGDGAPGMVDGALSEARFDSPCDVAVDASGRIFVSDAGNHRVRVIDVASSTVRTVAGDGVEGYADGAGGVARFFGQEGLDVTSDGKTVYVADGNGGEPLPYHRVRRIQLP